jgi:hypothetical protein
MMSIASVLLLVLLSVAGSQGEIQRKTKGYVEGGEVKPGESKKNHFSFKKISFLKFASYITVESCLM